MDLIEIFTLVTGLVYLVLEIRQKNAMWIVGMLTSAAAVWMFASRDLYASMILNIYYLVISAAGFVSWRKDRARLERKSLQEGAEDGNRIHLNRLNVRTVLWSAAAATAGTAVMVAVLKNTGDPMPWLDAMIAVLNAIATYWLSRSYFQQWYILVVANIMSVVLCLAQGLPFMTAQYVFYTAASVYGLVRWRRRGVYL